ncbi:hypothetical protein AMS68_003280 [Peltaster fructicola]|uniref:Uncharacterized protein n=1 Tax=Peltaster fructicola TaxID=286661 RepID=A0A6H0XSR9_9PEZI|nr:hypothetical protein AMS68_003280 [Peltaster fructicola]
MADTQELTDLAQTISQATQIITKHRNAEDGDSSSTEQMLKATAQLIQATTDMQILVSGPENFLKNMSLAYHEMTAMAVVVEFNLAPLVPLESSITFQELAKQSGAPPGRLERVLRLLFLRKIFYEPTSGSVAHTAISRCLVTNPELTAYLGHCTHEAFPAASRLVDSMRRYSSTEGPSETGFNIAFDTPDPMFSFMAKHPERYDRFNKGMAGFSKHGGRSVQAVVDIYPWDKLNQAVVADVGGGHGHVAIALAKQYPELSFVVQDLSVAVDAGARLLAPELKKRVAYEAHDMFDNQTDKKIGVFFLRHILHDWPDEHAIKILRALIPAMQPGSRVLIMDLVIPPPQQLHGLHEKFIS